MTEKENTADKICFVISPIGDTGTPTRSHADKVLKHLISKCVPAGFKTIRADKISDPGIITNQIISLIESADIVVADLTDSNPNVFYELAIRHALRKPTVQIINAGGKIPFDIAAVRTVVYDLTDPDALEMAQEQLAEALIYASGPSYKPESPFTVAIPAPSSARHTQKDQQSQILDELQKLAIRIQNIEIQTARKLPTTYNALSPDARFMTRAPKDRTQAELNDFVHNILYRPKLDED
ncbi:hypothetical protein [Brevundimonas sp. Root1423]|uniref:hypothetical protein n=1 Tax=Brevundimonas sp. Root1423 TaxID=1736462 RepID=UPI0012E3CFA5|nr:hypothetical protein [Brevundimonas sp. Root1423]